MISLGTSFRGTVCPQCKHQSCTMVSTEIVDWGTHLRKAVFDACPKCGKKLTSEVGFVRDLTEEEVKQLYNSKGKLNENKRPNAGGSSKAE